MNNRRKTDFGPVEHDRRRTDPQVFFNRLRNWEALVVALLILVMACLFASTVRAAEFPADVTVCKVNDFRGVPSSHQQMCLETSFELAKLAYASGLPCEQVVAQIMSPARKAFFVTCAWHVFEGSAVHMVYGNYRSINGHAFKPSAPDGRDYFVSN
jgi:hypothetical protein